MEPVSVASSGSTDKPKSKLDSLSREELLVFVKKQALALRNLKDDAKRWKEGKDEICKGQTVFVDRDCQTEDFIHCDQSETTSEGVSQLEVLKSQLAMRTLDLEASRMELCSLKSELDRLSQPQPEDRQNALLRMEIDEYRQSIKKLQGDIRQLGDLCAEKSEQLKLVDENRQNLLEEMQRCKESKSALEKRCEQLQQDNSRLNEQLRKVEEELKLSHETFAQFRQDCHTEKLRLTEELGSSHSTLETANSHIKDLKYKVADLEREREQLQAELCSVTGEFEAYKVRSQAVLKQKNLTNSPQWIEHETQERELLEDQLHVAQKRLAELSHSYDCALVQIKELSETGTETKERLESTMRKAEVVENALRRKLEHFSKQSVEAVRTLEQKLQEANDQLERTKRDLQDQLRMKDENHAAEKAILERKLQNCQSTMPIYGPSEQVDGSTNAELPVNKKSAELNGASNATICSRCGDESSSLKQPLFIQVGSAAEKYHRTNGHLLPLEDLLERGSGDLPTQSPSMSVSDAYEEHRIRVQHLTELLYEAELTGSRLTEQNRVLKEEIRRLTRNEERQRHLSNAEYLKNVVLKFVNPKFHDARLSLLPVLTTMLSLSKEEAAELEKIAASDGTASSSSFSSPWYGYLQRWSGGFS
ncbi:hypothetical protein M513_12287 [Trichuris suis]|uniref:GRIP domain-containing protein n=1 Tax=Trichuris suis TaxID=68888 RepID=A0A085LPE5_9BILA|nr:hypothetical protein M513_12287 [Trichuris suis]